MKLTKEQIYLLFTAWDYCDQEDKSTEFMFAYMADFAGVDENTAMDFVINTTEEERQNWYKKQGAKK